MDIPDIVNGSMPKGIDGYSDPDLKITEAKEDAGWNATGTSEEATTTGGIPSDIKKGMGY